MKNQKGFIQILLIGGVVIVLALLGYVFYSQKLRATVSGLPSLNTNYSLQAQPAGNQVTPIQNTNDLNNVSANLDSQDTTQIDSQLNALNSVSSGF